MKKLTAIILSTALIFTLTACGEEKAPQQALPETPAQSETEPEIITTAPSNDNTVIQSNDTDVQQTTPGGSLDELIDALGFMPELILWDDVLGEGDIPNWGEPLENAGIKMGTYLIDLSGRDADEFIKAAENASFLGVENPDVMKQGTYCLFEEPAVNLDPNYEYRNRPFLLIMP